MCNLFLEGIFIHLELQHMIFDLFKPFHLAGQYLSIFRRLNSIYSTTMKPKIRKSFFKIKMNSSKIIDLKRCLLEFYLRELSGQIEAFLSI